MIPVLPCLGKVVFDRRRLPFRDPARAFTLEQDFHGGEHDGEVLENRHFVDIHQVVFQFFVRLGVVSAVHLSVAGQSRLDLQTKREGGDRLAVLFRDLGAFGARTDDGHIALEDVEELREFVEADGANELADRGDAVVVRLREPGNAVTLRVDAHTPELEYVEPPCVFGQADLLVQHGAAVVEFDRERGQKHGGRQYDNAERRSEDIEQPFRRQVKDVRRRPTDAPDRSGKRLHVFAARHHDVPDVRNEIRDDVFLDAILGDRVPERRVDAGDEDRFRVGKGDLPEQNVDVVGRFPDLRDHVELLLELGRLNETALVVLVAVDQHRPSRMMDQKIDLPGNDRPQQIEDHLRRHGHEQGDGVGETQEHDHVQTVQTGAGEKVCKRLGIDQFGQFGEPDVISRIDTVQNQQSDAVSGANQDIITQRERRSDTPVKQMPAGDDRRHADSKMKDYKEPHDQISC